MVRNGKDKVLPAIVSYGQFVKFLLCLFSNIEVSVTFYEIMLL